MKLFTKINNALLMPLAGSIMNFSSGVFDSEGNFIEGSMLGRMPKPAEPAPPSRRLRGVYVFGGYLFKHYGHFLLESLSRAYAWKQCKAPFPIVFMTTRRELEARAKTIFHHLGVTNEIRIIDEPTQVDALLFSLPGSGLYPTFMTPEQMDALGTLSFAPAANKIWLSRSYLSVLGGITNEADLENDIARLGFDIVHPERLSSLEQIRLIASASVVAGFDGSAFFTALLAKKAHGHFCIFGRRNRMPEELPLLLSRKNISLETHVLPVDYVSGHGAMQRFHLNDTTALLDILKNMKEAP